MWTPVLEYTRTLRECGYEEFTGRYTNLAVGHPLSRTSHLNSRSIFLINAKLKSEGDFRRKIRQAVQGLGSEAEIFDRMCISRKYNASLSNLEKYSLRQTEISLKGSFLSLRCTDIRCHPNSTKGKPVGTRAV